MSESATMSETELRTVPPGRQNLVVAVLAGAAAVVFLDRFGIAFLFPQIGPDLHLSNSQLASLIAVTALASAVSSLVFTTVADRRRGRDRIVVPLSVISFSIAIGLLGLAHDYGTMLLLRAVVGLCAGPAIPLIQSFVARNSSTARRGRNLGIVVASTTVTGAALAPGIMVGLSDALGWRSAFPVVAGIGVVIAVLAGVVMRRDDSKSGGVGAHALHLADLKLAFTRRNVLLALVGSVVVVGEAVGYATFAPLFLAKSGLPQGLSTLVLTVSGVFQAIGAFLVPALSDRIGRKPMLLVASVCVGLMPLLTALLVHATPLLLVAQAFGLLAGGALPLFTFVVPSESVPLRSLATTFAVLLAISETLGGALAPQIGGAIADATGSIATALLCYAAAAVVPIVVALLLVETAPRRAGRTASPLAAAETRSDLPTAR